MAKQWRLSPSQILKATDDEVTAFFLDRAIGTFGAAVEADISTATKAAKSQQETQQIAAATLMKWLGVDPSNTPGLFKDPAKRPMKF